MDHVRQNISSLHFLAGLLLYLPKPKSHDWRRSTHKGVSIITYFLRNTRFRVIFYLLNSLTKQSDRLKKIRDLEFVETCDEQLNCCVPLNSKALLVSSSCLQLRRLKFKKLKGVFSKPSGDCIVVPNFCFLSQRETLHIQTKLKNKQVAKI